LLPDSLGEAKEEELENKLRHKMQLGQKKIPIRSSTPSQYGQTIKTKSENKTQVGHQTKRNLPKIGN